MKRQQIRRSLRERRNTAPQANLHIAAKPNHGDKPSKEKKQKKQRKKQNEREEESHNE